MNKLLGITLIFIILGITGCTHKNVEVYKVTDSGLTCNDLLIEIGEVKALNNDIDEKTGISGRNVGMGLIFWPGIIVNQMNASEARELANKRMERLVALSEKNNCNLSLKNNYSNENESINKDGFDKNGFDKDGFDKDGFDNLKKSKKELEDKRLKNLVNSTPNINTAIESNIKKQEKDKYESDKEYFERMKTLNFNTSAIMDIDITKEYNPNEGMYKIFFDTNRKPQYLNKIKYGKEDNQNLSNDLNLNKFSLSYNNGSSKSNELRSNAYGATVNVTTYLKDEVIVFPNNLEKILNMKNLYSYKKEYLDNLYYYIAFPVTKQKAKELDNQELKLRINIQFENIFDIYKGLSGSKATISSPTAIYISSYCFKGYIKEFVLFNKTTGEILFSYVDFSNRISN